MFISFTWSKSEAHFIKNSWKNSLIIQKVISLFAEAFEQHTQRELSIFFIHNYEVMTLYIVCWIGRLCWKALKLKTRDFTSNVWGNQNEFTFLFILISSTSLPSSNEFDSLKYYLSHQCLSAFRFDFTFACNHEI